jgi:hypothetical protein
MAIIKRKKKVYFVAIAAKDDKYEGKENLRKLTKWINRNLKKLE